MIRGVFSRSGLGKTVRVNLAKIDHFQKFKDNQMTPQTTPNHIDIYIIYRIYIVYILYIYYISFEGVRGSFLAICSLFADSPIAIWAIFGLQWPPLWPIYNFKWLLLLHMVQFYERLPLVCLLYISGVV